LRGGANHDSVVSHFVVVIKHSGLVADHLSRIVLRALQRLGASGIYALVFIVTLEMVPSDKYPKYTLYVTLAFAVSLCVGPLCGGAINEHATWRWVFLLKHV
jgi:MFS family permease